MSCRGFSKQSSRTQALLDGNENLKVICMLLQTSVLEILLLAVTIRSNSFRKCLFYFMQARKLYGYLLLNRVQDRNLHFPCFSNLLEELWSRMIRVQDLKTAAQSLCSCGVIQSLVLVTFLIVEYYQRHSLGRRGSC